MPERQSTPGGATAEQDAEAEPRGPAVTPAGDAAGLDEEPTRPVRRRASAPVPPGEDATVGFSRAITPTASAPSGRLPDDDRSPADDRTARVGTPDATVAVPDHPTAGQNRDGSAPGRLDAD